jgi:Domain of unknown function (DUF4124)
MLRRFLTTALPGMILCTCALQCAHADIYAWVDASGNLTFSDLPPPAGVHVVQVVAETPRSTLTARADPRYDARRGRGSHLVGARPAARAADRNRQFSPAGRAVWVCAAGSQLGMQWRVGRLRTLVESGGISGSGSHSRRAVAELPSLPRHAPLRARYGPSGSPLSSREFFPTPRSRECKESGTPPAQALAESFCNTNTR